jgi:hypothetical protein
MGIQEEEEIHTKGIDNLFNRIITEKFPNLEKERVTLVQESYRTPNHQDQKRKTPRHMIKTIKYLRINLTKETKDL